jgi:hypothetical protein
MSKDLTTSSTDRQNVLNNPYALAEIEKAAGIQGIPFEGKSVVLKEQVAAFFEVTVRTIENYLEEFTDELAKNGYEVVKGNRLKTLKSWRSSLWMFPKRISGTSPRPRNSPFLTSVPS